VRLSDELTSLAAALERAGIEYALVGRRLDAKIGLDAAQITSRLRLASDLRDLCVQLARLGQRS